MTTENDGFDVSEFVQEGMDQAGLSEEDAVTDSPGQEDSSAMKQQGAQETEQAETKPEEEKVEEKAAGSEEIQAALQQTEEQEPESVISAILPKAEDFEKARKSGQYVPVDDHIKLRQRAQKAEQERDELRQKIEATPTGGGKSGEAEKSPLEKFVEENPEEDFVPAKVQLEERRFQDAKRRAEQDAQRQKEESERQEKAESQKQAYAIKALNDKALKSESEFRKSHEDYDAVTKPFVNARLLSREEMIESMKAKNPAQRLYEICMAKKEALGDIFGKPSTGKSPKKPTEKAPAKSPEEKAEEDMTDEEIFESVYGKPEE